MRVSSFHEQACPGVPRQACWLKWVIISMSSPFGEGSPIAGAPDSLLKIFQRHDIDSKTVSERSTFGPCCSTSDKVLGDMAVDIAWTGIPDFGEGSTISKDRCRFTQR